LYAGNAALFVNPDRTDVDVIMIILQRLGAAMGLKINVHKSSVAPICCSLIDLDNVLHSFDGEVLQFPINYLSLPLSLGSLRMNHLQPILDRASGKLSGWQGKLFNIGGRRELVKSVPSSLPTYLLTAVKVPKSFYKAMDKLRRFLWARSQQLHGVKCKVNWEMVCHPLKCGGLGITDLEAFGQALRLRWLWFQWISPDKPWCNSELQIDSTNEALFAAAMKVHLGPRVGFGGLMTNN
jgi:hypothetical protein